MYYVLPTAGNKPYSSIFAQYFSYCWHIMVNHIVVYVDLLSEGVLVDHYRPSFDVYVLDQFVGFIFKHFD